MLVWETLNTNYVMQHVNASAYISTAAEQLCTSGFVQVTYQPNTCGIKSWYTDNFIQAIIMV